MDLQFVKIGCIVAFSGKAMEATLWVRFLCNEKVLVQCTACACPVIDKTVLCSAVCTFCCTQCALLAK